MNITDIFGDTLTQTINTIVLNEGGRICRDPFQAYLNHLEVESNNCEMFPRVRSQKSNTNGQPSKPKRKDKYLEIAKKRGLISPQTTLKEFNDDPMLRFVGVSEPQFSTLLLDDYLFNGMTASACIEDLCEIGYEKERIFVTTWGVDHSYLYNSDLEIVKGIPTLLVNKFYSIV